MTRFGSISGGAARPAAPWQSWFNGFESRVRVCAIGLLVAIGAGLAGCATPPPPPPPPPKPMVFVPPPPPPPPSRRELPTYYRLRGEPTGKVPARVALLLPFSSPSAQTRALAEALEKAAELAIFDSKNADILLMPRDEGASPERAADAARQAIDDGAEIIVGPLFAQSVSAVAPIARAEHVPVIAFSSDRSVGGDGVYLLSFQPETEVNRVVSFAAARGHTQFAALVPQSPYGDVVAEAFRRAVGQAGGTVVNVQSFIENIDSITAPARGVARSGADAILIGEGRGLLQAIAPALAQNGARRTQLLGTGLWADPALAREPMLANGWFAAPTPDGFRNFTTHFRENYSDAPPRIATLSYDALSLVALLSNGTPYQRFTDKVLTDPNGFAGVDGIFRFRDDGAAERGLAILQVTANGFRVVDPAPKAFPMAGF
jgi:branched-chain amino acid transport system substrate-binding protein